MNHDDDHKPDDKPPFDGQTRLYIRTHPADDGTEPLPSTLPSYVSPDITVRRPGGLPGSEAVAGTVNQVEVIVTNGGGIDAVDAYVDAFVADPSTAFTPTTATPIGGGFLTIPGYSTAMHAFPWTPTVTGHRCLLARVRLILPPDSYSNGSIFDVIGDRHVAQRNIHVVALAPLQKTLSFGFHLVNPLERAREFVVQTTELRIGRNLAVVREAIGGHFGQFGETPLEDIRLTIGEVVRHEGMDTAHEPTSVRRVGVLEGARVGERVARQEVRLGDQEARHAIVTVSRNPDTRPGDLHVVQVAQLDRQTRRLVGGLWLVVEH